MASRNRRKFLGKVTLGALGLSLADYLCLRSRADDGTSRLPGFGQAKACIVLWSWGGMSQLETWDPKPEAPSEVRGDYNSIETATPGVRLGEGLPRLARHTEKMAIVRAIAHQARDHRQAAFLNFTGRAPIGLNGLMVADPVPPTRQDPPCLGAMLARVLPGAPELPRSVVLPYAIAERGLVAGQNAGFLGPEFDPVVVRPTAKREYEGVSPTSVMPQTSLSGDVNSERLHARQALLSQFDQSCHQLTDHAEVDAYGSFRHAALSILASDRFHKALDVSLEPPARREAYGEHLCGQSVLTARRLADAGVPLTTVFCAAGDLNGSFGSHWDLHFQIFSRIREQMLPPLDQASAALLDDLAATGALDHTLVVWLTEFGRSPAINNLAGRDHWPDCYSIALAGAGIQGGVVHGSSDRLGGRPQSDACRPEQVHATILHALGITPEQAVQDALGRPHRMTTGRALPLFG